MGFHQVDLLKAMEARLHTLGKESPTENRKKGMEKEEMIVLHLFTIVTSGKESIRAEAGQKHLKPQGFPQGRGIEQKCNLSTDTHGQAQRANPYQNNFITNTRRYS